MDSEARLEKNKSGYWEIRWTERDGSGGYRTRTASTRRKDRDAAEAVMRGFLAAEAEEAARRAQGGALTVGDLLDGYVASAIAKGVGETQRGCVAAVRAHFGGFRVGDLTPEAVLDYGTARGVAAGTLRRDLGALVAALGWAVKHGKITKAPEIDLPAEGEPRAVFLPEDLERDLFDLASQDDERWSRVGKGNSGRLSRTGRFICIALDTGARKSAIQGLTWDRVDMVRRVVDFRDPTQRSTKKRRVATPIPDRLFPVLQRAQRERRPGEVHVLDMDGDVTLGFRAFMERHGFDEITPHVLRHTRITLLLRAGVSLWDVSALVGASPDVIQAVYGHHVSDDRLRNMANKRSA